MLVDVQVRDEGEWTVISVVGELDLALAPRVRHAVVTALGAAEHPDAPPLVVVDLGSVHFIDSSGLGVLLGALRRVRQLGGILRVVIGEAQVVRLFDLLELGAIVDVRTSLADALAPPPVAFGAESGRG